MSASWRHGTREAYGSGLLVFHVFCDLRDIPEQERCPAHPTLVLSFLAACAGSYSGSALANHFCALRAWHTLHGLPWVISDAEAMAALDGATALAPSASKQKKRDPFTIQLINTLCEHLDVTKPMDAAISACLKAAFFSMARLGEYTVRSIASFDPTIHVKRGDMRPGQDREGNEVTIVAVPKTKVADDGEDLYYARQNGPCDPVAAMDNHLRVNEPPANSHLFSYRHGSSYRPLTRSAFTKRLNEISKLLGMGTLRYHGIRIGSVLEFLLRGVPLEVVKNMGRWGSEAFAVYLRKHAIVLAPFMQDNPVLEPFTRITLPPVR